MSEETLFTDMRELLAQTYRPMRRGRPDTFVVSYPKCGVTWLRYMVADALGASPGGQRIADEETFRAAGLAPVAWSHNGGSLVLENGTRIPQRALFRSTHVLGFQRKRVLLLVRDPRDTTVSHYHQVTRRTTRPLDVGTIDDFYVHPTRGIRRTLQFYRRWERSRRLTADFHLLRYEDLRYGNVPALRDALLFLGIPRSDEEVHRLFERSSTERMRESERAGSITGMASFGHELSDLKVRRAVVGSFRAELSPESIAVGDRLIRKAAYPFGYCP